MIEALESTVRLEIKNKEGIRRIEFEIIKAISENRFILYGFNKLYIGRKLSLGLWEISDSIDTNKDLKWVCETLDY